MTTEDQIVEAQAKCERAKDDWQAAGASERLACQFTEDRRMDYVRAQNERTLLIRQQEEEQRAAALDSVTWVRWNDALGDRHGTNVPTANVSQFTQALLSAGFTEIDPHTPEEY